jgi:YidC/Oxa1 family membrane protein insertase
MQEQGKRLLLAVTLALGVLLAWQYLFAPKESPKKPVATQGSGSAAGSAAQSPEPISAVSPKVPACGPEQTITLTYPTANVAFCSHGGVLKSWHLNDLHYEHDSNKGELIPQQSPGAFIVNFADSTFVLPEQTEWKGEKTSDTQVRYTFSNDTFDIEKTFDVVPATYVVKLTVKVKTKKPNAQQTLTVSTYGFHDPKVSGGGGKSVQPRVWDSASYAGGEHYETGVKAVIAQPRYVNNIKWTGFEHPYMLAAIAPRVGPGAMVNKATNANASGLMRTDLYFHPALAQEGTVEMVGYFGPKNYKELEAADRVAGFSTHFKETIDLGWFAVIGRPLMWLLLKFYSFLGNWGLAIMLLTLLVKALTIPFTTRSMRSMKAIAVLAPELKELQAKYKDDRARLQAETMALYRQHGANPLSGCLPIFLQMPIWLALYRMLSSTGELFWQPFIPGWINDLSAADPYHVLPALMMITMFAQARLQPTAVATDSAQKMQQRMMQYGMPLMFGVMSFFFPAGLTLYIFTNTCLSAVHSIYMNKYDKKSIALAERLKASHAKTEQAKNQTAAAKAKDASVDDDDDDDDDSSTDDKSLVKTAANKPRPNQNRGSKKKKRRR